MTLPLLISESIQISKNNGDAQEENLFFYCLSASPKIMDIVKVLGFGRLSQNLNYATINIFVSIIILILNLNVKF
jgi:hypothetical protein